MTEAEQKLRWDDYLTALEPYSVYQVQKACAAWLVTDSNHFPNPGQLIAKIVLVRERSIAEARANAPTYRVIAAPEAKYPYLLKPWRQIFADNGRPMPAEGSPLALALDRLQTPPDWARA